jgi:hypothetical protein
VVVVGTAPGLYPLLVEIHLHTLLVLVVRQQVPARRQEMLVAHQLYQEPYWADLYPCLLAEDLAPHWLVDQPRGEHQVAAPSTHLADQELLVFPEDLEGVPHPEVPTLPLAPEVPTAHLGMAVPAVILGEAEEERMSPLHLDQALGDKLHFITPRRYHVKTFDSV